VRQAEKESEREREREREREEKADPRQTNFPRGYKPLITQLSAGRKSLIACTRNRSDAIAYSCRFAETDNFSRTDPPLAN